MRDRGLIVAGLAFFLLLITFPIWYDLAAGTASKGPDPVLPKNEKFCVMPREYMKDYHMQLLMTWRDQVVRNNVHTFVAFNGKKYRMSLTGTCLGCHTNKAEFCDRCHSYAGVNPYCWDCHIDPKLVRKGTEYAHR